MQRAFELTQSPNAQKFFIHIIFHKQHRLDISDQVPLAFFLALDQDEWINSGGSR
jgi:hypothetical protein